jgi:antagonist of KipI
VIPFGFFQLVKMNLRIIKAGILDTIQDQGRYKYQYLGINPGGAMDKLSAQVANFLVGNNGHQAIVELHFPASEFFFEQPALIAIGGANFSANVNGEEIPCLHPVLVSKYSILQFHGLQTGARAYLAVNGGFDIPKWLGSYSTNLKAVAGGYKGRAFQKDDEIGIGTIAAFASLLEKKEFYILPWKADTGRSFIIDEEIKVLPGREWNRLTEESKEKILRQSFTIASQSDRMGYRLKSEPLSMLNNEEIISSAVSFGTVQLLPDGQLIVLMADHQTAGGYPRVAHVITAHLSRLAQMQPGEKINFNMTDLKTAEELLIKQQQHLQQLQNACTFRLSEYLKS